MKFIALDPGGTTGYAVGDWDAESGSMRIRAAQSTWTHTQLYAQLVTGSPDVVVCESFEYRNRARPGLELISCELIGVVKLYCNQHNRSLRMQTASQGKSHFSNEKLKDMNLYLVGKPHANDAQRHLLQWYYFGSGFQYNQNGIIT